MIIGGSAVSEAPAVPDHRAPSHDLVERVSPSRTELWGTPKAANGDLPTCSGSTLSIAISLPPFHRPFSQAFPSMRRGFLRKAYSQIDTPIKVQVEHPTSDPIFHHSAINPNRASPIIPPELSDRIIDHLHDDPHTLKKVGCQRAFVLIFKLNGQNSTKFALSQVILGTIMRWV